MVLFLLCRNFVSIAADEQVYNPVWVDSVLVQKEDSAGLAVLKDAVLIDHQHSAGLLLQPMKTQPASVFYLLFVAGLLLVALLLRVLFDDFSESMLKGVISSKAYYVSLRTNKYDSPVPLIYIFLAKNLVLSVLTYLLLEKLTSAPRNFDPVMLVRVMILVTLFSAARSFLELLFNWIIGTVTIFKAFTLQQWFIDFFAGLILLSVLLIGIYQPAYNLNSPVKFLIAVLAVYLVFNTIRSYQLLSNVRVNYHLHFFLYICTFKILPVLLLAKYLLSLA